ncbi:hypothetical protein CDD82_1465 [Ophiocordyceps australis]|uniref:FAD-binding PCMH-type domain-containing protein n=1 Tax=Ophiocordyceps australis TaxID=1399860 RepID=A0A2C5YIZ8_9HYPO|nr:hypothetical protein CDD82_1465 [Ophiocordyceps australis]
MVHFTLVALAAALPALGSPTSRCKALDAQMPGRVSFPSSSTYKSSLSSYYSGQERELNPGCIFRPTSTDEVVKFVRLITKSNDTRFAVRGGGHTLWSGAANVNGGITVDMREMNSLELSSDEKVARLGAGGVWDHYYAQLGPKNLTVMGGRVPGIGVGGFASGGGITFLSRRHGFSCENILGYEIVLASGKVVYATEQSHPDLWMALKGGSNNFGIITRADVATFPLDKMWYNLVSYNYSESVLQAQANAFSNFMKPQNFDSAAMMGIFLDYRAGSFGVNDALWYIENKASPAVYKPFTDIPNNGGPAELTDVNDVVKQFGSSIPATSGRSVQLTFSFTNPSPAIYMELFKVFEEGIAAVANVQDIFVEFLTQPQPVSKGINLFGLETGKSDYVLIDMTAAYTKKSDDARVTAALKNIVKKQRAVLKKSGNLIEFIYLNYADISQPVLQSWGADNLGKLRAASTKYDPHGVFQKQSPGGYKLFK